MKHQEAELAAPSQKLKVTWVGYFSFFSPLYFSQVCFPAVMAGGVYLTSLF